MLTHTRKEAGKIYKTFHWDEEGDTIKFDKVIKASKSTACLVEIFSMNATSFVL